MSAPSNDIRASAANRITSDYWLRGRDQFRPSSTEHTTDEDAISHHSDEETGKQVKMSPSLVLCVLFLAMAYGNVEGTPYDKIKELFNYGATFEEKGTLYPSGNHWVHYFEIELQTFPFVSEKPTPCSNCPWYSEAMVEILALHRQTAVDVGTILGEIKSLLPHHSLARLPMTRRRRSFLPFIGSLAKTLFGTSTSSDLNSLSRNVALIRANQQKMAKATAHQIGIFAAAIRNFDSRIDNIFQGITDNHEAIEKLGENFNNSLISSQVAQVKYGIRSFLEIDWADFAVEDSSFAQKFTMPSKILKRPGGKFIPSDVFLVCE
ncbi:uncharacterized protein LOC132562278 [Ylistrum balloti]|uniref:uncharacterized protein LOC132562278 n=1 Tax=Ylistrum balloti TaxID=509963 RepID=UPI0029059654|nr:uncharacterized protein LOC132562278 [Ylistrum balloti]